MKLYVAAHSQLEARVVARMCRTYGHTVTSTWLDEDFSCRPTAEECVRIAAKDVEEIRDSDALVVLASVRRVPGGKFIEVGVALGRGIPVYLLGHRENVLMHHPEIKSFLSVEDMLPALPA